MKSRLLSVISVGIFLFGMLTTANAALVSRLGGQAVYDTDLNITWLRNSNLARSNTFGVAGIDYDGGMSWYTANSWINSMNTSGGYGHLGYSEWRLPIISELSHLSNDEGIYWDDPSPPMMLHPDWIDYWSNTEYTPDTNKAWTYGFDLGGLSFHDKNMSMLVWPVLSGDVSAVPVPSAVWLCGSGLLGLVGMARRKKVA